MSAKNPIRLYVTHSFASHSDYHRVFEYLEAIPNFFYRNCSVPDHPPSTGGKEALKEEYRIQMKSAEVVIVLSSLYTENEYWTTYQMDVARIAARIDGRLDDDHAMDQRRQPALEDAR